MNQKGIFVVWMEKLFGLSWRTSFYGLCAFLVAITDIIQQYLVQMNIPPAILRTVTALLAMIAIMQAKDGKVTGGTSVQPSSSEAIKAMQIKPINAPIPNDPTSPKS